MNNGQRFMGLLLGLMLGLSLLTVGALAVMDTVESPAPVVTGGEEKPVLLASDNDTSATPTPTPTPEVTASPGGTVTPTPVPTTTPAVLLFGDCGEGLKWVLSGEGVLTITGTGAMTDYEAGTAPWYDLAAEIRAVNVGEGVISLGENAFSDCTNIQTVSLPATLVSIGAGAFQGCNQLTTVTFAGREQDWDTLTAELEDNQALRYATVVNLYADVNGDGTVSAADIATLMSCVIGAGTPSGAAAGDYTGDDVCDILDVIRLLCWWTDDGTVLE